MYSHESVKRARKQNKNKTKRSNIKLKKATAHIVSPGDECLAAYVACLADPFGKPPSCVPIFPALPSRKCQSFTRGTFNAGIDGHGFIMARPSAAYDINCLHTSAVGFSFATYTTVNAVAAVNNSSYTNASFGATAGLNKVRFVSCGIRVRYADTELNKSGSIKCLQSADHTNLNGADNWVINDSYQETANFPMSRKWIACVWTPQEPDEMDFGTGSAPTEYSLGIHVTGVTLAQYEYEYFVNYEVIGRNAGVKTPSEASPWVDAALGYINDYASGAMQKISAGMFNSVIQQALTYALPRVQ